MRFKDISDLSLYFIVVMLSFAFVSEGKGASAADRCKDIQTFSHGRTSTDASSVLFQLRTTTLVECTLSKHERLISIRHFDGDDQQSFNALFDDSDVRLKSLNGQRQLWKSFWVTGTKKIIDEETHRQLREILASIPQTMSLKNQKPGSHTVAVQAVGNFESLLSWLVHFVEPETAIPSFLATDFLITDLAPLLKGRSSSRKNDENTRWKMICHSIGKTHRGIFTDDSGPNTLEVPIGDPDTRCRGRCGLGCSQPLEIRQKQYTQECLDHDVCRDHTGQQFGVCEDEFWAASASYILAPNCNLEAPSKFILK